MSIKFEKVSDTVGVLTDEDEAIIIDFTTMSIIIKSHEEHSISIIPINIKKLIAKKSIIKIFKGEGRIKLGSFRRRLLSSTYNKKHEKTSLKEAGKFLSENIILAINPKDENKHRIASYRPDNQ